MLNYLNIVGPPIEQKEYFTNEYKINIFQNSKFATTISAGT